LIEETNYRNSGKRDNAASLTKTISQKIYIRRLSKTLRKAEAVRCSHCGMLRLSITSASANSYRPRWPCL